MPRTAIRTRALRKSYGGFEAVKGLDLTIPEGEIFALLGPNGAGKTTTVEILEGHRDRTSGEVAVLDHDPADASRDLKRRIGIVLQDVGIEPYLTVAEVIDLYRGYYPNPRPGDETIELVGLQDKRGERVKRLSGGQRRRLDVAIALCGDPDLLFLDEPTTGFDPSARRSAWQMLKDLRELGKTIFLTTHYMEEAQELADRVAILVEGRIVAEGSPAELSGRATAPTTIRFVRPAAELPPALAREARVDNGQVLLSTSEPTRTLHELTSWAVQHSLTLEGLTVTRPSLEDVYLALTDEERS